MLPNVNVLNGRNREDNLDRMRDLVSSHLKNHGEIESIKRLKLLRLVTQQYCLKQELSIIPYCKTDNTKFPRKIKFLKPNRRSIPEMRYVLSVWRIIELFKGKVDTNTSTIENTSTLKPHVLNELLKFIRNKSKLVKNLPDLKDSSLILSNKAGPNGPATITCIEDVNALRKDPILYYHVSELIKHSNLTWLRMDVQPHMRGNFSHSKIVFLSDRALKTRVVAIAD